MVETLEQRAVARCADEMARASMYLRALRGIEKSETYHGIDFIQLAHWALYDQMIGHVIKVLRPKEKAGLWFLVRAKKSLVARLCAQHGILLGHVRVLLGDIRSIPDKDKTRRRLLLIRDKTHFHLDAVGVQNSGKIWEEAAIAGSELESAIDASLRLLCLLHKEIRGTEYPLPYYDGSDATKIAEHAYKHGLLSSEPVDPALAALFGS